MKKILLLDNTNFSYICSSILKLKGYRSEAVNNLVELKRKLTNIDNDLLIINYPVNRALCDAIKKISLPKVLLLTHLNSETMKLLNNIENVYCMMKPIDYDKFLDFLADLCNHKASALSGYCIV